MLGYLLSKELINFDPKGKMLIKSDETAKTMQSRNREGMPEPDSADHVASRILFAIQNGEAEIYMR